MFQYNRQLNNDHVCLIKREFRNDPICENIPQEVVFRTFNSWRMHHFNFKSN
jgi:hypothetical protein